MPILHFHPSFFHQHKKSCYYLKQFLPILQQSKFDLTSTVSTPSLILFICHHSFLPSDPYPHQYETQEMNGSFKTLRLYSKTAILTTEKEELMVNSFYEFQNPAITNGMYIVNSASLFKKLMKLNERYVPESYTVRQLIQLLLKKLLEKSELFHLIGLFAGIVNISYYTAIRIKDFEFDEMIEIRCSAELHDYSPFSSLFISDLCFSPHEPYVRFSSQSSIQLLSLIPSHSIEPTIPLFLDFPWFSSQFYIWIHVDIENVYKLIVKRESTSHRIQINCELFANTQTQPLHMYICSI